MEPARAGQLHQGQMERRCGVQDGSVSKTTPGKALFQPQLKSPVLLLFPAPITCSSSSSSGDVLAAGGCWEVFYMTLANKTLLGLFPTLSYLTHCHSRDVGMVPMQQSSGFYILLTQNAPRHYNLDHFCPRSAFRAEFKQVRTRSGLP